MYLKMAGLGSTDLVNISMGFLTNFCIQSFHADIVMRTVMASISDISNSKTRER